MRARSLFISSSDKGDVVDKVLAQTTSGNVTVNDTLVHHVIDDLPFGGVGPSGMGAYHGEEGTQTFSAMRKASSSNPKRILSDWCARPFGRFTDLVLRYLLR